MLDQVINKNSMPKRVGSRLFSVDELIFILIMLSPFASNYVLYSNFSFGDFFVLIVIPWLLYHFSMRIQNLLYIFTALAVVAVSYAILGFDVYYGFYRAALYFLLFFMLIALVDIDFDRFFKIYIKLSLFAVAALFFQWVFFTLFDYTILLQIPIPYYEPDTLKVIDQGYRSGGFFKEPSYFALFIAPAFFYHLIKGQYARYGFIALAGVLSTSSLAFFLILASVVFLIARSRNLSWYFIFFAILLGLMFWSAVEYLLNFIFVERIVNIFENGGTLIDRFYPFLSIASISDSLFANNSAYHYFLNEDYWFNSASSLMAYFGFLGLILIVVGLFRLNWIIAFCFLALIVTTHFMSNAFSFFVMFSFFALDNIAKKNDKI